MLKKGEMAQSVRERNENVRHSVAARFVALKALLLAPTKADMRLVLACETQAKLAALSLPELGIGQLSLNAMKAAADADPDHGGWSRLDTLRRTARAFSSCQANSVPKRGLSDRRRERIIDLTKELEKAHVVRNALGQAYRDALAELRRASKNDEMTAINLQRHLETYCDISSFRLIENW